MRAPTALIVASLAACAGPTSDGARPAASPAAVARPEPDPAARWSPRAPNLLPVEQVLVRARRSADGGATLIEFLSPSLTEAERVRLRLAYEKGELRLSREGAAGEETWTTTLTAAPR